MNQDELKRAAARAAIGYVSPGQIVGVGSGSTVNFFIDELAAIRDRVPGAVSSSERSTERLLARGIPVLDLNTVVAAGTPLPVYVDGADEINDRLQMIKGGGGALTREKIVAQACERFVCIVDASKLVEVLGAYPLPVEVIPMASAQVASRLREIGARPAERAGFVTDNGNLILDAAGLAIVDAPALEAEINQWPGVVTVGLFARRGADVALIASEQGIETRFAR
ncbi:MAG TPA: ribose-5-phosphate isomerase RpiA [Burkholderiaceae bacterium]